MSFQVRSEETGLKFFETLEQAYKAWEKDKSIWKISFKNHRWIYNHQSSIWEDRPIVIVDCSIKCSTVETLTPEQFKIKCLN